MNENVIVTSMVNGTIIMSLPQNGYFVKKTWPKKGTKLPINKEALREAYYRPGVEALFRDGDLYIEDMAFKIELGLEEEETKIPTKIIPLDEKYANRILKLMPLTEMRAALKKMSDDQLRELLDYAADQNDIQLDRLTAIKEVTGTDLFKVIELKRQKGE
jgi:hypothetical protein